jgi:hypothetical protein
MQDNVTRLCCLFFFDLRILITPLVSSNSSNTLRCSYRNAKIVCYIEILIYTLRSPVQIRIPISTSINWDIQIFTRMIRDSTKFLVASGILLKTIFRYTKCNFILGIGDGFDGATHRASMWLHRWRRGVPCRWGCQIIIQKGLTWISRTQTPPSTNWNSNIY